jgi:hypothetical protein
MDLENTIAPVTLLADETTPSANPMNFQVKLTFSLMKTPLTVAFQKNGTTNTFLLTPTDAQGPDMKVNEMIADVNKLLKVFDDSTPTLDQEMFEKSLLDISNTVCKGNPDTILPAEISIHLEQAFILHQTGKPLEYAFMIAVDTSDMFPSEYSIFNVDKLSISVWSTKREKVLRRMELQSIETLLDT